MLSNDNEEMEMGGMPLEEESVFKESVHYFGADPSINSGSMIVPNSGPLAVPNSGHMMMSYNRSISGGEDMSQGKYYVQVTAELL